MPDQTNPPRHVNAEDILSLTPPPADARIAYGSDPNQFLDLRLPPRQHGSGSHPLVMNIHGGFWRARYDLEHAGHLCAALAATGAATANLEYRRVGNVGGGWPGTFADIRAAYGFLVQNATRHALDPRRLIVMGHSAGGQLALCLAAHEPDLAGAISLAGVVDLQRAYDLHLSNDAVVEFLGGKPGEVEDHYREADPMRLSIPKTRQFLIHGSDDDVVPVSFSRDYVAAKNKLKGKKREYAELIEIQGAGHFNVIDPRTAAWKQVEGAVMKLIG